MGVLSDSWYTVVPSSLSATCATSHLPHQLHYSIQKSYTTPLSVVSGRDYPTPPLRSPALVLPQPGQPDGGRRTRTRSGRAMHLRILVLDPPATDVVGHARARAPPPPPPAAPPAAGGAAGVVVLAAHGHAEQDRGEEQGGPRTPTEAKGPAAHVGGVAIGLELFAGYGEGCALGWVCVSVLCFFLFCGRG